MPNGSGNDLAMVQVVTMPVHKAIHRQQWRWHPGQNNGGEANQGGNQGGNPDGPPPGTIATGPGEGDGQPGENQELTVPSDEDIEKDGSIMGVFNDLGGQDLPPQYTQKSVENMDHVTISGNITCKGDECDVPFVLRITPSFQPTEEDGPLSENLKMEEGGTITSASISRGGGAYSIKVPKSNGRVVLELLLDADDDESVYGREVCHL